MKILQVITSLNTGGAEKLLLDISPRLIKKGHEVDILVLRDSDTPFRRQLEKEGVKVYSISDTMNYYNPLFCVKLYPFIKGYDVVHVHLFPTLYWVALSNIFHRNKIPLVYTEHSTDNGRRKYRWLKWIEKIVYNQYERIIAISEGVYKNLTLHLSPQIPAIIVHNGVDVDLISKAEAISFPFLFPNCKHIVQVASFRKQKDQDTVIRALSLLPDNYHLSFVGAGSRMEICKSLATELNIEERVHFLLQSTKVPNILKSADIVVMSSHYEGFGLAAVEGMAAGKPVLATNVSGLRDVVNDKDLLFEVGDYIELANKIQMISEYEDVYRKKSYACLQQAFQYDIQATVSGYEQVYKIVCQKNE